MKKTMSTLLVVAGTFAVSGAFAAVDKPNPNPNDCRQYGVTYQVETTNDPNQGYRESVVVSRPSKYEGDVSATVTRERRDGSTYQTQMDSRDTRTHNYYWGTQSTNKLRSNNDDNNNKMETNTGNGDRVKSVDLQCYPNSK